MGHTSERRPGLRERKKARTREAIQAHALRLFTAQGYEATTVDQIAEAAEISQSTFFRYFPTKEDVLLYDPFDPLFFAAYRAAPKELNAIQAVSAALHTAWDHNDLNIEAQWQRQALILANDGLRARMIDEFLRSVGIVADLIGERSGRPADDIRVRTAAAALLGVGINAWLNANDSADEFIAYFDAGLEYLGAGLPL